MNRCIFKLRVAQKLRLICLSLICIMKLFWQFLSKMPKNLDKSLFQDTIKYVFCFNSLLTQGKASFGISAPAILWYHVTGWNSICKFATSVPSLHLKKQTCKNTPAEHIIFESGTTEFAFSSFFKLVFNRKWRCWEGAEALNVCFRKVT